MTPPICCPGGSKMFPGFSYTPITRSDFPRPGPASERIDAAEEPVGDLFFQNDDRSRRAAPPG